MINRFRKLQTDWSTWVERSTNRKIFEAALTVGFATIIVRGFGMVKEMTIAHSFGVSAPVDAYLIAMLLPSVAINSVAVSFSMAIIPALIKIRQKKGENAAAQMFSSAMVVGGGFLSITVLLLYLIGPYLLTLLTEKYDPQIQIAIHQMFLWLLPMIFISGTRLMYSAAINAEKRFTTVALAPAITSIFVTMSIVVFAAKFGVYSLIFGILGGSILELVLLAFTCRKHRMPIWPKWSGVSRELKAVITQFAPLVLGALLLTSTGFVDQVMAASLGGGSVAALSFGNKIVALCVAFGTKALATATLPYFSDMVEEGDWLGVRHTLKVYIRLLALITIPVTAFLIYLSDDLISLIFERGEFTVADTLVVGRVQAYYLLQVPFVVITMLAVRLIIAMERGKILMWGTIISVILNIILNLVFMRIMGIAGIALSTSCVFAVSFVYLWSMLYRILPKPHIVSPQATD